MVCFLLSWVVTLIVMILNIMVRTPVLSVDQLEVFKLQFQQFIQRSHRIHCVDNTLEVDEFVISLDRHRIVKKEGYEILLEDVSFLEFECDRQVSLHMMYKGFEVNEVFEIE